MNKKQRINLLSILLGATAVYMIYLGIKANIIPPIATGVGFFLILWALQEFK